jgi:hypothetical protein
MRRVQPSGDYWQSRRSAKKQQLRCREGKPSTVWKLMFSNGIPGRLAWGFGVRCAQRDQ